MAGREMIAAKPPETPSLRQLSREAIVSTGGDAKKATADVVAMLEADRKLLTSIVSEAIRIAAYEAVQGQVRQSRAAVVISVSEGRSRVAALAGGISQSMLDFPIAGGLNLRDATADQVSAQAQRYERAGSDMMRKSRWLRLIAQCVPPGKIVGEVLSDERANELWNEATK